jgi:hypothetical protein
MKKIFDINVGDHVWLMHNNAVVCATVTHAFYTKFISCIDYKSIKESESYKLSANGKPLYESYQKEQLFLSKADLINSL